MNDTNTAISFYSPNNPGSTSHKHHNRLLAVTIFWEVQIQSVKSSSKEKTEALIGDAWQQVCAIYRKNVPHSRIPIPWFISINNTSAHLTWEKIMIRNCRILTVMLKKIYFTNLKNVWKQAARSLFQAYMKDTPKLCICFIPPHSTHSLSFQHIFNYNLHKAWKEPNADIIHRS